MARHPDSGRRELSKALDSSPIGRYSGAALVVRGPEVIFQAARGLADRERSLPNRVDTCFAIGSLTKQFTAAAILRLEMEGRLSTDDPIRHHLGDLPGAKNDATIHHLLTHTAGLIRAGTGWVTTTRAAFVQAMKDTPMESPPGTRCRYSNAGFGLLGAIIENVGGEPYDEVLASRFFRPLGMTHSGCVDHTTWLPDSNQAAGHRMQRRSDGGLGPTERVVPGTADRAGDWSTRPAAGVTSTVGDLHRWEVALAGERILSREATRRMFSPWSRMPGRSGHYAYGWCIERSRRGEATIFHPGRHEGFQAAYIRYPDRGVAIILLANVMVDDGDAGWHHDIQHRIEAILFG
ncbi:MAG TPA: serine hydrolase domain-containing protein [Acidimicrobiales bacterium]|nr:serine hydrolase domain-containing protein [Acidimicrobiales bacterium]